MYSCGSKPTCDQTFATWSALNSHCRAMKHVNSWPEPMVFKCEKCKVKFKSGRALAMHRETPCKLPRAGKKKKFPCQQCKRAFKTPEGLAGHIKQPGRSHQFFACKSCSRSFLTQKGLDDHTKTQHPVSSGPTPLAAVQYAKCSHCPLIFNTAQELADHIRFTHNRLVCSLCERSFISKVGLDVHTKANHPSSVEPLRVRSLSAVVKSPSNHTCHVCERFFLTSEGLNSHTRSPGKSHKFECKLCNQKLSTKLDLDDHTKHAHQTIPTAVSAVKLVKPTCDACKRSFKSSQGLADHILSNSHKKKEKMAMTTTNLPKKNQSIASRPRDMKCVFCSDKFKSPSGIAQHIEAGVHKYHRHHVTAAVQAMGIVPQITVKDGTEPPVPTITTYVATAAAFNGSLYACSICMGTFETLQGLNAHLNSAAHDAAEFKCPKCLREFTLISGLVQHLESRCCGLAPLIEIDGYFNKLEDQFTRTMVSRQIDM